MLERLNRGNIAFHPASEKLLSPCQLGFKPDLSTLTQLTRAQLFINDYTNQLRGVDGVYTDLSKASDTISYKKFLLKLQAYSINESLLNWINHSYLTNPIKM